VSNLAEILIDWG